MEPNCRCLSIIKILGAGSCHHLLDIIPICAILLPTRNKMKLLTLVLIFLATMVYGSLGFILLPIDVTLDVGSRYIFEPVPKRAYNAYSHGH